MELFECLTRHCNGSLPSPHCAPRRILNETPSLPSPEPARRRLSSLRREWTWETVTTTAPTMRRRLQSDSTLLDVVFSKRTTICSDATLPPLKSATETFHIYRRIQREVKTSFLTHPCAQPLRAKRRRMLRCGSHTHYQTIPALPLTEQPSRRRAIQCTCPKIA